MFSGSLVADGANSGSTITFFAILLMIAPATAGVIVRARARLGERLRHTAGWLRAARDGRIDAVVTGERQRIAGELDRVMLRIPILAVRGARGRVAHHD